MSKDYFVHEAGKGSRQRDVDKEKYDFNHDLIFAKKVWVDPPSGWMYGFPAIWDKEQYPKLEEFLRFKEYPEKDIEFACSYMRMWLVDEPIIDGDKELYGKGK